MEDEKWKFLNNEILTTSIITGITRGDSVYRLEIKDRENFKKSLKEKLEKYRLKYNLRINSVQHTKNIESFANEISREFGQILKNNRFKIGRAQKMKMVSTLIFK